MVNEQLTIACPTRDQIASLSRRSAPTPSSSPVHTSPGISPATSNEAPDLRAAMIEQFSQWSGMRPEFAENFLSQHDWDPNTSGNAFSQLKVNCYS